MIAMLGKLAADSRIERPKPSAEEKDKPKITVANTIRLSRKAAIQR
jgi:hypothetical protein